jgi:hypothetical protein
MENIVTNEIKLSYQEREALHLIRKTIQRRPEVAAMLLEGMAKEAAVGVMLKIRDELQVMLDVNRAFSEAAAKLAKIDKEQPCETST